MKKEFLILLNLIFLSACSSTSSNFTHIPLPSFKAHFEQQNESSDISVAVKNIEMQRINQYSKDFEDSILKIRLDKEIELLVKNLQKDSEKLLASKGFVVNNTNATYTLYHKIDIYIQESDMNKKNQWLSGEELSSKLHLSLSSNLQLKSKNDVINMNTNVKFDAPIAIAYPIKSSQGTNFFKTTLSTVPTQINKGLEQAVFDIDKVLLNFHKDTLDNLNKNSLNLKSESLSYETPNSIKEGEVIIFE